MEQFLIIYMTYQSKGKTRYRKCSTCNEELKYKYKRSFNLQEKKNGKCLKCSKVKIFSDIYKNFNNLWCRICPECKNELSYKTRQICISQYYKNTSCKSCTQIGNRSFWYGKKMSESTKKKMSEKRIGKRLSKITKQKLSDKKIGNKNPMYGNIPTEEYREKLRNGQLRRLEKQGISISYNPKACKFIDELNKKQGWNLQHALNGGEIKLCGYSLDGYDKDRNIIFEYDEKHHRYEKFIKKDKIRQKNLIEIIKPNKFLRYDEWNDKIYDVLADTDISQ